jgi:hypothetical protein
MVLEESALLGKVALYCWLVLDRVHMQVLIVRQDENEVGPFILDISDWHWIVKENVWMLDGGPYPIGRSQELVEIQTQNPCSYHERKEHRTNGLKSLPSNPRRSLSPLRTSAQASHLVSTEMLATVRNGCVVDIPIRTVTEFSTIFIDSEVCSNKYPSSRFFASIVPYWREHLGLAMVVVSRYQTLPQHGVPKVKKRMLGFQFIIKRQPVNLGPAYRDLVIGKECCVVVS